MAYLILDLDETAIVIQNYSNEIHSDQKLSKRLYQGYCGHYLKDIHIINPRLLSDLIQTACSEYDGVILFTSGFWHQDIRSVLADNLDLSDESRDKLIGCPFYSPVTESVLWNEDARTIRELSKGERFEKIMQATPEFRKKFFVMLDDHPFHINSFDETPNVRAVLAETDSKDRSFYEVAIEALASCRMVEMEEQVIDILASMIRPAYSSGFFSSAVTLKRKRETEACDNEETENFTKRVKI